MKKSITRETTNQFVKNFDQSIGITTVTNNATTAVIVLDEEHGLQSLKYHSTLTGGSGHTNGTYFNVRLLNNDTTPASAPWDGATAKVVVSGNSVTSVEITEGGSGYTNGEELFFDSLPVNEGGIGGAPSAKISITTAGISSATGNYIQVTGLSTGTDSYHRIQAVDSTKQITVKKTANEVLFNGQQIHDMGPWVAVGSATTTSGITEFTTPVDHGLVVGNQFRILNSSDANLGDFVVTSVVGVTTFSAKTTTDLLDPKYILKHGLSDNESISSAAGENIDVRGYNTYDHESLVLKETINTSTVGFAVSLPDNSNTALSITRRFPLGSYIQIGGEIMRIASSSLSGSGGNEITVIRGSLGTNSGNHLVESRIKKIKPLPIELRRPSILRSSGHTFEYVGFGPGNYSTALPQLQNRSLTEREEFLNQSQETSCGNVVYTGMNDKGDFYIGNTKIASASGQQTTFDIPVPTVTGEDPNRLSFVADEVIVKERLLVEGGSSKQILSQFDGPVTLNHNLRLSDPTKQFTTEAKISAQDGRFRDETNTSSVTTGSVVIDGGLGLAKDLRIGGNIIGDGATDISGIDNISAASFTGDGAGLTNTGASMTDHPTTGADQFIVFTDITTDGATMTSAATDPGLKYDVVNNQLHLLDNIGISLGDDNDTTFTHTTNNGTRIDHTGNEDLRFRFSQNQIIFEKTSGENFIVLDHATNETRLAIAGSTKLRTQNTGIDITGILDVSQSATIGNITIDVDSRTISTNNNNALILTSGNDDVEVSGELYVSNKIFAQNTAQGSDTTGSIVASGGILAQKQIHSNQDIVAFSSSDITLKENISPIQNALDKVMSLTGNVFAWKPEASELGNKGMDTGILAQEVEKLGLPGVTRERNGIKSVRYERLIPVLIEAIKELTEKVKSLESNK